MRQPFLSTSTAGTSHRKTLCVVAIFFFALVASLASAEQGGEGQPDRSTPPIIPDRPDDRWRESGLVQLDLPLGFRARFDAAYSDHLSFSDVLAQPFVDVGGPAIPGDHSLDSRFALTRRIAPGIEFEIAWGTRNSLATSDPLGFGRQTIGARIRIAP